MTLGALPVTNVTDGNLCHVVFSESQQESRRDIVAVYRPQYCYNNLPQVFCSVIDSGSIETCTAMQGSPVVCGDRSAVAGFVLTDRACSSLGVLNSLDFHSVGDFREWIQNVSGADKLAKLSMLTILSTLLISAKNFL